MGSRALDQRLLNQATGLGLKGGVKKAPASFLPKPNADPGILPNEKRRKSQGEQMVKALRLRR